MNELDEKRNCKISNDTKIGELENVLERLKIHELSNDLRDTSENVKGTVHVV